MNNDTQLYVVTNGSGWVYAMENPNSALPNDYVNTFDSVEEARETAIQFDRINGGVSFGGIYRLELVQTNVIGDK